MVGLLILLLLDPGQHLAETLEIAITAEQSVLTVEGRKADKQTARIPRGISSRPFKRQFNLADYVQVKGAAIDNGLLQIELVREVPEAMKPRRISIADSPASTSGRSTARRLSDRRSETFTVNRQRSRRLSAS